MQKTNFKTRLLALLTAVFMVVMCMPFAALADAPDVVVDLDWDKDQVEVTDWGSFGDVDGYVSATVKPGGEVVMPTVKGINGYKFKGWTNVGNKTKLTLADVTPYLGVGKSTLQLKAIAEKAPVVADTIVTVDVLVDTDTMKITNYGDFKKDDNDDGYATANFDKPGKELTLPTVEGINGYTFTGWDKVGTATSLTTERAKALCADGKSTLQLSAIAEKAPVVADTIVTVDVLVDTNTMKITNYGDFKKDDNDDGYATANFDKPGKELTLPTVEGINGYTFTGWDKVGTATSLTTEEALKLCADGKTTVVLNAQAGFTVSFIDRDTKESVGGTYTVKFDATGNRINVSSTDGGKTLVIEDGTHEAQTIFAPDGYQLNVMGGYTVEDGKVVLPVEKIPEPEAGFTINFVDDEGNVASDLTFNFKFNPTDNKVEITTNDDGKTATFTDGTYGVQTIYAPDGYKIVTRGGQLVENGVVSLKIAKIETKPTIKFYVMFKDGETISGLKYGFKYDPEDGKVNISSKDNGVNLTIDEGTSHQQTFKAPEGYRVIQRGDYTVEDGKVILPVEKIPEPEAGFTINFVDDEGNVASDLTFNFKFNPTDNKVEITTNDDGKTATFTDGTYGVQTIYAPDGYKIVTRGGQLVENGVVSLKIAKIETKPTIKFYVMFKDGETISGLKYGFKYDPEDGKVNISSKDNGVNLTIDEGTSHQQTFKAPEGYRVTQRGDYTVEDGKVILNIEKIPTQKSVALNYILDGKTVGTTTLMVNADATKVEIRNNDGVVTANGQQIIAPEGYVFCNFGDFFIEQDENGVNYINLSIAAGTKEITLTYYVEGTDKNETVGTEKHTVATNATKIKVREVNGKFTADGVAITAPNGYKLVVSGDFFIENNNVNLKVVKVESKNNSSSSSSSSSSASSSSNTTNTSASQKQVVKAAAAPANTTKVLPKTGATNTAPLIGGSLAVVALLMGYGVYGLVLRKKD